MGQFRPHGIPVQNGPRTGTETERTNMGRKRNTVVPVPVVDAPVSVDAVAVVDAPAVDAPVVDAPVTVSPVVDGVPVDMAGYDAIVAAIADDATRAELGTPGARAIAAGLMAARFTVANADAIRNAVGPFVDAARDVNPAIDERDNVARWTARNITTGQNVVYAVARIVRVPDAAIAVAWVALWPGAKCDYAERHRYIASTRTDVNHGRHGWDRDTVARYGGPFGRFTPNGTAF